MSFDTPIHTNEQSIARVLRAGLPTLLVFWRTDCAPCGLLNPALDRLARDYAGKLLIAKLNTADNAALVRRYRVTHLPTLLLLREETQLGQVTGAAAEVDLRRWLEATLNGTTRTPAPSGPSIALSGATAQPISPPASPQPSNGASQPLVLTDASFDRTIGQRDQPVLVDFWAPWCGPCRMLTPTIQQLAQEFAGRAVVAKLNIDEQPRIARRYGIMSIPAVYIFRGGQVVEQFVGVQPAPVLRQALTKHLR